MSVPYEETAIDAEEAGKIFGCDARTFLRKWACLPGFPVRLSERPAKWTVRDLYRWRDEWKRVQERRRAA